MKRITYLMVILTILLTSVAITTAQGNSGNRASQIATHIVVFKDGVTVRPNVPDVARAYGLRITNQYEHVLNGFAAVIPRGRLNALSRDPRVAYIEENMVFSITAQ